MSKPVFKKSFEKYNNQPATTRNGMPTPTDSALRMRKSRRKKTPYIQSSPQSTRSATTKI